MARTLRTSYAFVPRAARDGSVRTWTTRGRRVRGEIRERHGERQAARRSIAAEIAALEEEARRDLELARIEEEAALAAYEDALEIFSPMRYAA